MAGEESTEAGSRTASLLAGHSAGEVLRSLLESMQDVFYRVDREDKLSIISRSGAAQLGYPAPEELLGRPAAEFWHRPDQRGPMLAAMRRDGAVNDWEITLRRRDGTLLTAATSAQLLRDADGAEAGYQGLWRNIDQRKKEEERLRQSEEKFSKIFLSTPDTIVITRARDGLLLDVNPGFCKATGWTREEAVGRSTLALNLWADPEQRARMVAQLKAQGEVLYDEFAFRRKDGALRSGVYSARALHLGEEPCLLFVMQDVTERQQLERQLRQAQKLEAIGQVAGGVAHDFNNLLTVQIGSLGLLAEIPDLPEEARELLADVEKSARAAANLTRQLLAFSRRQVLQTRRVDLAEVLRGFLGMLRRVLREDVSIDLQTLSGPLWLDADVGMLEQVLMNLAVNARDAMPAGGRLTIACDELEVAPGTRAPHLEAQPGRYVRLTVADTGEGMDAETLRRAFEPFFTTKPAGQGTGLGLATVYGIVRQHGGFVEAQSERGAGTVFHVYYPARSGPLPHEPPEAVAASLPRGRGQTVLLVEDDLAVRRTLRAWLDRLGYRALEAADGAAAVALWESRVGLVHLLLTDVVMPGGTSGVDLLRRLRETEPGLPAIVMSGYSRGLVEGGLPPDVRFLAKPCDPAELARALAAELERAARTAGPAVAGAGRDPAGS